MKKYWYLLIAVLFLYAGCTTDTKQPTSFQVVEKIDQFQPIESSDRTIYVVEYDNPSDPGQFYVEFTNLNYNPSYQYWYKAGTILDDGLYTLNSLPESFKYSEHKELYDPNVTYEMNENQFWTDVIAIPAYSNETIRVQILWLTHTYWGDPVNWFAHVVFDAVKIASLTVTLVEEESENWDLDYVCAVSRVVGLEEFQLYFYNENNSTWYSATPFIHNSVVDDRDGLSFSQSNCELSEDLAEYLYGEPRRVIFAIRGLDDDDNTFVHTEKQNIVNFE